MEKDHRNKFVSLALVWELRLKSSLTIEQQSVRHLLHFLPSEHEWIIMPIIIGTSDYGPVNESVVFKSGESHCISIEIASDELAEKEEDFTVILLVYRRCDDYNQLLLS